MITVISIIVATIALVVLIWGVIHELPSTRGWAMEKSMSLVLSFLPKKDYKVMNNLYFRDGRKSCQIDHLIISRFGIFVIETKNYLGVISGYGNHKTLLRRVLGLSYRTRNPIDQNNWHIRYLYDHIKALRENPGYIIPLVVFNYSSALRIKNAPCKVIKIQQLLRTIKSYEETILDSATMQDITDQIQLLT